MKGNENILPQNYEFKNVHSSLIHKSPKLETTEMSMYRKMDKQLVVYFLCVCVVYSQYPTPDTPNNTGESQNHCVK